MIDAWPPIALADLLSKSDDWIDLDPTATYREVTVRLWGKGVVLRREVAGDEINSSRRLRVRAGQFILSRIDARNGAFGLVPTELDGAVVSNDFPAFNIRPERLLPEFLGWLSKTKDFVDLCRAASEGTTNRVRLKEDRFLRMSIPLPPLPEQRRIVAKIDHLAAKIDEANGLKRRTLADLRALLPSAYASMYDHAAAMVGTVELNKLCRQITDGTHSTPVYVDEGIPFLSVKDITSGRISLDCARRITTHEYKLLTRRCKPERNDVLLTKVGTTGYAKVVDVDWEFSIFVSLALLKLNLDQVLPEYVEYMLNSSRLQDAAKAGTRGVGNQNLVLKFIKSFPMPCPPLDEQRRIVAYLDGLQAMLDHLKALQERTTLELDALLPAILDKAFKGELVVPESIRVAAPAKARVNERQAESAKHSRGIYFKRGAIAAYIIDRLHHRPQFGRVMLEKCLYLAEAHVGIDLEGAYRRAAAGPLDAEYLIKLESLAAKRQWFTKRKSTGKRTRYDYRPGRNASGRISAAVSMLADRRETMDHLLDLMAKPKMDTERAEIVATLFAAWNDRLIAAGVTNPHPEDPAHPSADEIIAEVRDHWHEAKKRFDKPRLLKALKWMRDNDLVPRGIGPRTQNRA